MSAVEGIRCDSCLADFLRTTWNPVSATRVRAEARRGGWHTRRGSFTTDAGRTFGVALDICAACWEEGIR